MKEKLQNVMCQIKLTKNKELKILLKTLIQHVKGQTIHTHSHTLQIKQFPPDKVMV